MATVIDFSYFKDSLSYVNFFGETWVVGLILVFLTALILSRSPSHWGIVFLPLILVYNKLGVTFGFYFYPIIVTIASLVFLIQTFSIEGLSKIGTGVFQSTSSGIDRLLTGTGLSQKEEAQTKAERDLFASIDLAQKGNSYSTKYDKRNLEREFSKSQYRNILKDSTLAERAGRSAVEKMYHAAAHAQAKSDFAKSFNKKRKQEKEDALAAFKKKFFSSQPSYLSGQVRKQIYMDRPPRKSDYKPTPANRKLFHKGSILQGYKDLEYPFTLQPQNNDFFDDMDFITKKKKRKGRYL